MVPKYICSIILLVLSAYCSFQQEADCIEGESWLEKCKKCECLGNNNYSCKWHSPSCSIETLQKDVTVFESNRRCHYVIEKQKTICVEMDFQKNINGKPCEDESYLHDSCSLCKCEHSTRTYRCKSIAKCSATNGICNPGETVMENICFKCSCTFTRLRVCSLIHPCFNKIEKRGNCPTHKYIYSRALQDLCTYERYQECYTDHSCPGTKKCCHVVDCFLRCIVPVSY